MPRGRYARRRPGFTAPGEEPKATPVSGWEYRSETKQESMNQLGRDGWECYAVTSGVYGNLTHHFKRKLRKQ